MKKIDKAILQIATTNLKKYHLACAVKGIAAGIPISLSDIEYYEIKEVKKCKN